MCIFQQLLDSPLNVNEINGPWIIVNTKKGTGLKFIVCNLLSAFFSVEYLPTGTIICPATESFVHWRDIMDTCEWGLNFTNSNDAKRFRDCCMVSHIYHYSG